MIYFLRQIFFILGVAFTFAACSHQIALTPLKGFTEKPASTGMNESYRNTPVAVNAREKIIVKGHEIDVSNFDIPMVSNSAVEKWVDYFTGRGRPHFEKFLMRSEYFIPYIVPILAENQLPRDLVYVAMIESGFSNHAKSKAKAVGPWQFIRPTAVKYGLQVDYWVDERKNVEKSTRSAVLYFRNLYQIFDSWELAAASYNAGESRIANAIRRYGSKDFWTLTKHQYLAAETRNYVPKWFAAALLSKNRKLFGFEENYLTPQDIEKEDFLSELPEIEFLTPEEHEKEEYASSDQEGENSDEESEDVDVAADETAPASESKNGVEWERTPARLSYYEKQEIQADLDVLGETQATGDVLLGGGLAKISYTPHTDRSGKVSQTEVIEFEVESPADLNKIAKAAGISLEQFRKLNPDLLQWCTPPGEASRKIKLPLQLKDRFLKVYNHPEFSREVHFMTYKVRKNDSLKSISKRFKIGSVDPILELNKMRKNQSVRFGQNLLLPLPTEKKTALTKR